MPKGVSSRVLPPESRGCERAKRQMPSNFPAEYPATDLASKTAAFSVTLHEVKELDPPAIDDDFARAVSENATVGAVAR